MHLVIHDRANGGQRLTLKMSADEYEHASSLAKQPECLRLRIGYNEHKQEATFVPDGRSGNKFSKSAGNFAKFVSKDGFDSISHCRFIVNSPIELTLILAADGSFSVPIAGLVITNHGLPFVIKRQVERDVASIKHAKEIINEAVDRGDIRINIDANKRLTLEI